MVLQKLGKVLLLFALMAVLTSCNLFSSSKTPKIDYPSHEAEYYSNLSQAEILKVSENAAAEGSLKVAVKDEISGIFMPDFRDVTESDKQIIDLLHGYSTVTVTAEGKYIVDPIVVDRYRIFDNGDGTVTYTFLLNKNLKYSDGTGITAADYVFSVLLFASPEWNYFQSTVSNSYYDYLGYKSYHSGDLPQYPGVRLIGDYMFSVTTSAFEETSFFDLMKAAIQPMPISVIAPGVTVCDDGAGAYLSKEYSSELLSRTVFSDGGYAYLPTVTSGPYNLKSFSKQTKIADLQTNPYYLGKYDGAKPQIQNLILKSASDNMDISLIQKKNADIIIGLYKKDIVSGENNLSSFDVSFSEYQRRGFTKLQFLCDHSVTSSAAVRKAIAYLIRYDELIDACTGGNAKRINSFYSSSMWEYALLAEHINALTFYSFDPVTAEQLLIDDGWIYNSNGEPYVSGRDFVRCRKDAKGNYEPLVIEWANTESALTKYLYQNLLPDAYRIGIKINSTTMDFKELLSKMKFAGTAYDMFSLGYGFTKAPVYWYYYAYGDNSVGLNFNHIESESLYEATCAMRRVAIGDNDNWINAYSAFLREWNALLPDIPLYEDSCCDVYRNTLKNYSPTAAFGFSEAIVRAYVQ